MKEDVTITIPLIGPTAEVVINTRVRRSLRDDLRDSFGLQTTTTRAGDTVLEGLDPARIEELTEVIRDSYPSWHVTTYDHRPVHDRPGDRVGWSNVPGNWGVSTVGVVGDLVMFKLTRRAVAREEPRPYQMVAHFPTHATNPQGSWITGNFATEKEAKRSAEDALTVFMTKLGAMWMETPISGRPEL